MIVSVLAKVADMQTEVVPTPKITVQADSTPIKKQRGGKRPGAGRKPNLARRLLKGFTRDTIALAVEDLDVKAVIIGCSRARAI